MAANRPIASIAQVTGLTDALGLVASKFPGIYTDFLQSASTTPWTPGSISSGTNATQLGTANHPGIVRVSSASGANSGYFYSSGSAAIVLAGGETVEVVFSPVAAGLATLVSYLGLHTSGTVTPPTDGAWIDLAGATLSGKTNDNTGAATTGTTYTVTAGVWYRGKVVVNADASRVDFYLYTADGALVWSDYLTTKIGKIRTQGCLFSAVSTGSSAVALMDFDYVSFEIDRTLVR